MWRCELENKGWDLDSANSSIDLKLKEAFYISKNKPDLNKQLHHFNTFLTL